MTPDWDEAVQTNSVYYYVKSMVGEMAEIWRFEYGDHLLTKTMVANGLMTWVSDGPPPPDKDCFVCWMLAEDAIKYTEKADGCFKAPLLDAERMLARYLGAKAAGIIAG